MALSLKSTRAVSGLANVLYEFLPGSGRSTWRGHITFGTVAEKVGVGKFWPGGSKKPAINALLSQTLEHRRSSFEPLILEIVRSGMVYREKQGNPVTAQEIQAINGHIYDIGFKFPDLWDGEFLDSLRQTTGERARERFQQAENEQRETSERVKRSEELRKLQETFVRLSAESDHQRRGLALERLLNRLFTIYGLDPRAPFRVTGEQIDGSFLLDGQVYLVEAKWEQQPLSEAALLVFRGKIEGKSTFTRGVFIALNDITLDARDAITRGKSPSFFVMNGYDLMMALCGAITLTEFVKKRVRLLAEEGRVCCPYQDLR